MIEAVAFKRFKQFRDKKITLAPAGLTLLAGGNNAGKSSLLHGLAVWEFCRTVVVMEKGDAAVRIGSRHQGLGLGDDEFSPIAVPSLKHLWTNLKTQRTSADADGYTLRIRCDWSDAGDARHLEFGLSMANDRLFIRATDTNLIAGMKIPRIAYLPPFAGITAREVKVTQAIRTRRIGEGLAGAVLRNILLELNQGNLAERTRLREGRSKIADADLRNLRATDPWEILQSALREHFSAELIMQQFREEYHSYIRVEVDKGVVDRFNLKRHPQYNTRDLMVEGSGFLQWLSVFALATSREVDVLLLDEPDAHLHPALQSQLVTSLEDIAERTGKQILVATHSAEILRNASPEKILEIRQSGSVRYLSQEHQKVGLLAGLGSEYAPTIDKIKRSKKVLFLEGSSDESALRVVAKILGRRFPDVPVWLGPTSHKDRRQLWKALEQEIPGLKAVSLRDRDEEPLGTVGADLVDASEAATPNFLSLKWRRRHIESYLLVPRAIGKAIGRPEEEIRSLLANDFALAVGETFTASNCPDALLDARGKEILATGPRAILRGTGLHVARVAEQLEPEEVCDDFVKFIDHLERELGSE
jgi:predicted ATPase